MDIRYRIEFFSDWHCGSGLSAGADVDALVIKDDCGLPFVPGKTVKGLVREAMDDILTFKRNGNEASRESLLKSESLFKETFGHFDDNSEMIKGQAFFTNAELPSDERRVIIAEKLQAFMYRRLSSTAIDTDGIAKEHSLRRMEVVIPCRLEGCILDVPCDDEFIKLMEDALHYIKRLGQNRNRGLGSCSITVMSITAPEKIN